MNYDCAAMRGHKPETPEEEERGYVLKPWRGVPRYACTRCPLESPDEGSAALHYAEMHVLKEALARAAAEAEQAAKRSRPAQARLYDGGGKLVEQIPISSELPGAHSATPKPEPSADAEISEEWLKEIVRDLAGRGALTHGADDTSEDD
jgi:hypothetical protein